MKAEYQVLVYKPLVLGGGFIDDNLTFRSDDLRENAATFGGYWTLTFPITGRQADIEEWLSEGLGRHIEAYGPGMDRVWEGFVSQISANIGGLNLSVGPLLDTVANRIIVSYSPEDTDMGTCGTTAFTTAVDDTASQAKYGIIEAVISASRATDTVAEQVRDLALLENAEPLATESDNLDRSSVPSARITCAGYVNWLKAFTYVENTEGSRGASTRITDVLAADPNGIFSADYSHITANTTTTVQRQDINRRTGWNVIRGVVSIGDTADNRYSFGIFKDRLAYYQVTPATALYERRLSSPDQALLYYRTGSTVHPSESESAQFVFYTDLLVGQRPGDNFRQDPRYLFIEDRTLQVPYSLTMKGERTSRLDQMMARMGLRGAA